jgi:membrane-bound lytic murein transglycosylase B
MPRLLKGGFVALVAALALLDAPAAHAAQPVASPAPNLSPDMAGIAVDSPAYRAAQSAYDATAASLEQATAARAAAEQELVDLTQRDVTLTTQLRDDTARKKRATLNLAATRTALRALAVHGYIFGADGSGSDTDPFLDPEASLQQSNVDAIGRSVTQSQIDGQVRASTALAQAVGAVISDITQRTDERQRAAQVENNRAAAAADEVRFANQLLSRRADLDQARAVASVVGEDFQLVALDAYWRAAQTMSFVKPACGITWWALAGIGRIESHHGLDGSSLLADGTTSAPIIGIPLDGTDQTQVIPDTDGGQFDGDPNFDHAVGPMQFIPETWRRWAQDGNGDHDENPSNMYDAALAAAKYLCSGGAMKTDQDMTRGFLAYNNSATYASTVLDYAHQYAMFPVPAPPPAPLPSVSSGR